MWEDGYRNIVNIDVSRTLSEINSNTGVFLSVFWNSH